MRNEIKQRIETTISKRMSLKQATLEAYSNGINKFCQAQDIKPFDFPKLGLEQIEDLTETYIISHVGILSPKYLNVIYNAIKTWCFVLKMIKNRKLFREIKFDKQSRKMDAMTEQPLETKHITELMMICNVHEKLLIGMYALTALRPSLIPQLKVKDFHRDDYKIEHEKIKFTTKNPFLHIPKQYVGNKAHITFFVIIPSQITKLIEHCLNNNGTVTKQTSIISKHGKSGKNIYAKVRKLFERINFQGRPYLLRSYGDRLLDRTIEDKDLKEMMMGHKGKMSAIYQFRALTQEDKETYLKDYATTEQWVNEKIFGVRSQAELSHAEILFKTAKSLDADQSSIMQLLEMFQKNKFSMERYEDGIHSEIRKAQKEAMKTEFETMFKELNNKYNHK